MSDADILRGIELTRRRDRFADELRGLLHAHGFSIGLVDLALADGVHYHVFAAHDPNKVVATWYVPIAAGRDKYDSRAAQEVATRVAGAWLRMRDAPDTAQKKWHGYVA